MEENNAYTPHPDAALGHETTDINVWAVAKFAIALVIVTIISLVLLFGLMKYFESRYHPELATVEDPTKLFPEPRLQRTPVVDLREFRSQEQKVLDTYGWIDQPKGIVRIPIDRAIDVLAARGLPSTAQAAKPASQAGAK
jgi:hypothetical protein